MWEGNGYKLIDPDGLFYEKAYDLGVLMREWAEEYEQDPVEKGKQRCETLHQLTGVPKPGQIWEWGIFADGFHRICAAADRSEQNRAANDPYRGMLVKGALAGGGNVRS